jgi:hypothetical protein
MKASWLIVLLRLAYFVVTNTVTLLRVLPMSDRDKDIEILALRHQLLILQRQVGTPTFTPQTACCSPASCTGCPASGYAGFCCWYGRTRSCAGTATCSTAATPRPAHQNGEDAHARSVRSAS